MLRSWRAKNILCGRSRTQVSQRIHTNWLVSGGNISQPWLWRSLSTSHDRSTIYALATPPGKSAIAIIRISGPAVQDVWTSKIRQTLKKTRQGAQQSAVLQDIPWPPPARKALYRQIIASIDGDKLDDGIVVYFPAATSLTGQDTLELQLHGSTAVIKAVLSSLGDMKLSHGIDIRPAEPGEFTRLAFDSGRMDLTEVEGLRDLIEAETETQRRVAMQQASGQMRRAYESMRADIISAMSVLEAVIDFGEDEGIGNDDIEPARQRILHLQASITQHLASARRGEILRNGIRLAIFGAPNAGKSSFLNWLVQREASIVTAHPGTTRDIVEVSLDYHGYPVIVADTAGLRNAKDEVEQIGVERARGAVESADVKLCIISLSEAFARLRAGERAVDDLTRSLVDERTLFVLNKVDAIGTSRADEDLLGRLCDELRWLTEKTLATGISPPTRYISASVKTDMHLDSVADMLKQRLQDEFALDRDNGEALLVTRERHRVHLEECLQCLSTFLDMDVATQLVEAAEELRYASNALGKVTGQVHVEDVLDELFRSFCIGK